MLDTNLIIGNGSPTIVKTKNMKNSNVETIQFLNQAKDLKKNIEGAQEKSTVIGKPLLGKRMDVFA